LREKISSLITLFLIVCLFYDPNYSNKNEKENLVRILRASAPTDDARWLAD
jgi:hypothetical protein